MAYLKPWASAAKDEAGKGVNALTLSYTFFNKGRLMLKEDLRTRRASVRATRGAGAVER